MVTVIANNTKSIVNDWYFITIIKSLLLLLSDILNCSYVYDMINV